MAPFLVSAVSWLLAISFAAVWGAHLYQVTVLFPVWASEPPKSRIEWLATPYAMRVRSALTRGDPAHRVSMRSGQDTGPAMGPMELRGSRRRDSRIDRGAFRCQSFVEKHPVGTVPMAFVIPATFREADLS